MTRRLFAPLVILSATAVSTLVLAHSGAKGVVKERMDRMGSIAESMKALGKMFKGAEPYDPDAVAKHATSISRASGKDLLKLFPKGSIEHPSEARPEIWADWERFVELTGDLNAAALALADGADNPRDAASETSPDKLFLQVAGTCKACHQDFRIKKK